MFFILLTFGAALFIEGLGSLVSVIGISALFGANPIIIALAIALDVGKIVVVSGLYTYWKQMGVLMKSYALLAAMVTMIITSGGAAGYLSGEFQKAIVGAKEGDLKVSVLKEQVGRYQERKKQIDDQIANLPERTSVNQRLRLINGFKAEQARLDEQIASIDKQLPELQVSQIGTEAKVGPILQISKAFNVPVEEAVKWVIIAIIFVFDPLAIFLIVFGNFLWAKRKAEKKVEEDDEDTVFGYDPEEWGTEKVPADLVPRGPDTSVRAEEKAEAVPVSVESPDHEWKMAPEDGKALLEEIKEEHKAYDPKTMVEDMWFSHPPPTGAARVETLPEITEVEVIPTQEEVESPIPMMSSMTDVIPDSTTIVDAKSSQGYRRPTTTIGGG